MHISSKKWVHIEEKFIDFLIKNYELLELLEKSNWAKVTDSIKKEFDSEPGCHKKFLKAIIKSYNGKINTNFHNNKIPWEGSKFIFLLVILIDSVFRTSKKYHLPVFLEECTYIVKDKKISQYITDDIEISSDSDREDSDEEHSNEENSN